jgi:hypothetical protein
VSEREIDLAERRPSKVSPSLFRNSSDGEPPSTSADETARDCGKRIGRICGEKVKKKLKNSQEPLLNTQLEFT